MNIAVKAASLLADARRTQQRLPELPEECRPDELAVAYEAQDVLVERLLSDRGGSPVGYKVGCTNKAAQQLLGLDKPFYGQLLSSSIHPSPAQLKGDDFFMRIIEPEFAFRMTEDLPPAGAPYDTDRVAAAAGAVLPAIEVADSCYTDWTVVGAPSLIADNGCASAWVQGNAYSDWRALDLAKHEVTLVVNGETLHEGRGEAVLGHPLNALTWLANALCERGRGLKAGDLISTGTCCQIYFAHPGDQIRADFGILGTVEVGFTGA